MFTGLALFKTLAKQEQGVKLIFVQKSQEGLSIHKRHDKCDLLRSLVAGNNRKEDGGNSYGPAVHHGAAEVF